MVDVETVLDFISLSGLSPPSLSSLVLILGLLCFIFDVVMNLFKHIYTYVCIFLKV